MVSFSSIVTFLLVAVVAFFFAFAGGIKLYPLVPEEHQTQLQRFPLYAKVFNLPPNTATEFRYAVGGAEVGAALLSLLTPTAHLLLAAIMVGAVVTHVLLQEPFAFPAVLVGINLLLFWLRSPAKKPVAAKKRN
eukprot:TRINITY_DN33682_c0_g1_i1.p2 TRINITY_DN33682_c0_g1~~TRINITY_DN33682_c0_g1_i1.p2  ORF type:complete len:156 (-),score=45.43 TRINITY_DN33682_c0_g1_i1:207-608(-)